MRASEIAVGPWVSAVWPATARARGNPTDLLADRRADLRAEPAVNTWDNSRK
jgi:hypothetical protein